MDASQQPAQKMVEAAKARKNPAVHQAGDLETSAAGTPRMSFASQKIIHTPETAADYAKRVANDKSLKNLG